MTIEKTIQLLESRLQDNPTSLLFAHLADLYIRKGRIDEAINVCTEGIRHNPNYVTGNFILGKIYLAKGDHDKAEAALKKVLSHDHQYLNAHKLLGDVMARMGWENKAAIYYRDILQIDPLEQEVREMLETFSFQEDIPGKSQKEEIEPSPLSSLFKKSSEHEEDDSKNWTEELEEVVSEQNISGPTFKPPLHDEGIFEKPIESSDTTDESEMDILDQDIEIEPSLEKQKGKDDIDFSALDELQRDETDILIPKKDKVDLSNGPSDEEQKFASEDFSFEPTDSQEGTVVSSDSQEKTTDDEEPPSVRPLVNEEYDSKGKDTTSLLFEDEVSADTFAKEKDEVPFSETDTHKQEKDLSSNTTQTGPSSQDIESILTEPSESDTSSDSGENDEQKIVSPTLGEIYIAQGQYSKAIKVYEKLMQKNPDRAEIYQKKIKELNKKLNENPQ